MAAIGQRKFIAGASFKRFKSSGDRPPRNYLFAGFGTIMHIIVSSAVLLTPLEWSYGHCHQNIRLHHPVQDHAFSRQE